MNPSSALSPRRPSPRFSLLAAIAAFLTTTALANPPTEGPQGTITPGFSQVEVKGSYSAEIGALSDSGSIGLAETNAARKVAFVSTASSGGESFTVDFDVDVRADQQVVRSEPDHLHFLASQSTRTEITGFGVATDGSNLQASSSFHTISIFEFTVAAGVTDFAISGGFVGAVDGDIDITKLGPSPTSIYSHPDPAEPSPEFNHSLCLDAGTYQVEIVTSPVLTLLGQSQEGGFVAEIIVGTDREPNDIPPLVPGDYTHPDVFNEYTDSPALQAVSPVINSETDLGNGFTEFDVSASLQNSGLCPWTAAILSLKETIENGPDITITQTPNALDIDAGQTVTPPPGESIICQVATPVAAILRASILDGSRFTTSGREHLVFLYPIEIVTPEDAASFYLPSGSRDILFNDVPIHTVNSILLEWEPNYKVPLRTIVEPNTPAAFQSQGLDKHLPILIRSIERDASGENILVEAYTEPEHSDIESLLKHGSITSEMAYEGHPEGITTTEIPENRDKLGLTGLYPAPLPIHFNRVNFGGLIDVSGSFVFKPKSFVLETRIENFEIKRLLVTAKFTADCDLLLETQNAAENSAEPLVDKEKTIFDVPLFTVVTPAGFQFTPQLALSVGATVSAPTSLSVPLTADLDVEITSGVIDGQAYYNSSFEPRPLRISDPGFYENLDATAEAWIDCELKCFITDPSGFLSAAPTIGAKATAALELAPFADPWWTMDADLSLYGGVEAQLTPALTVLDEEKEITNWPLFSLDAGGALGGGPSSGSAPGPPINPGIRSTSAPTTRWARSLLPVPTGTSAFGKTFIIDLANSDDVIVGFGSSTDGYLTRVGTDGELKWARKQNHLLFGIDGVAEPDGSFTVCGSTSAHLRIANYSGDGTLQWAKQFAPSNGPTLWSGVSLSRGESATGASEYYVLGQAAFLSPQRFLPSVAKLDAVGNLIWQKIYEVQPINGEGTNCNLGEAIVTADGNLVIIADTNADIGAAGSTSTFLANFSPNGLITKIDTSDGSVLWSTITASRGYLRLYCVTESPSGDLYAGGNAQTHVWSDLPSMIVSKFNGTDGSFIDSTLVGHAAIPIQAYPDLSTGLPHGGQTSYDTIRDIQWIDEHLWFCGQMGIFNAGAPTSAADGGSAFTARMDSDLTVSRYAIHAGPSTDSLLDLSDGGNGLLAVGLSSSFHPWPAGAGEEGSGTPVALTLMKLPWEGAMRFHLDSAGAQPRATAPYPTRGSHFVTPRQRAVSQYTLETNQGLFGGLGQIHITNDEAAPQAIVTSDFTFTEQAIAPLTTLLQPEGYKALEFLPKSLIKDLPSYLAWHQVAGDEDNDGDSFDTNTEFFFGTDLLKPDAPQATILSRYPTVVAVGRNKLADGELPTLWGSVELTSWNPLTPVAVDIENLDAQRDLIKMELDALPDLPMRFFQFSYP